MAVADRKVALLIETSKAFGRGLLAGVGRYARLHPRWSIYVEERGLDDPIPRWLLADSSAADRFYGMLIRSLRLETMKQASELGIPAVYLGEENPDDVIAVSSDDRACARLAAEHLLERHFRSFGYVGLRGYGWSESRRDCFAQCIEQSGFPCAIIEMSTEPRQHEAWYQHRNELANWIASLPKPVAVMACYDATARTLLDVCRQHHWLVPEQVAVVGVDNDQVLCELSDPPLTSVALDTETIGYEAARLLDQRMQANSCADVKSIKSIVVPPRGVQLRQSTQTDAIDDPEIALALGFIRRHACDGIGVPDVLAHIAESSNRNTLPKTALSRRTLERRFHAATGHSPLDAIREVRIQRVKSLLCESTMKLEEVASSSGFQYPAYMASQFRASEGMTPGEYRKLHSNVSDSVSRPR